MSRNVLISSVVLQCELETNLQRIQHFVVRHVESAYKSIRVFNALGVSGVVASTFFGIAPYCVHQFPYMFWTPFDPFGSTTTYTTLYLVELFCDIVSGAMSTCLDWYLLLVLVCMNFNYKLLGERVGRIGHQPCKKKSEQIECYRQMIELIKLHLKINR